MEEQRRIFVVSYSSLLILSKKVQLIKFFSSSPFLLFSPSVLLRYGQRRANRASRRGGVTRMSSKLVTLRARWPR